MNFILYGDGNVHQVSAPSVYGKVVPHALPGTEEVVAEDGKVLAPATPGAEGHRLTGSFSIPSILEFCEAPLHDTLLAIAAELRKLGHGVTFEGMGKGFKE